MANTAMDAVFSHTQRSFEMQIISTAARIQVRIIDSVPSVAVFRITPENPSWLKSSEYAAMPTDLLPNIPSKILYSFVEIITV